MGKDTQLSEEEQRRLNKQKHEEYLYSTKHYFDQLIKELTGWENVDPLAEMCVQVLVRNLDKDPSRLYELECSCGRHPFDPEEASAETSNIDRPASPRNTEGV